jgi:hypothetical protein
LAPGGGGHVGVAHERRNLEPLGQRSAKRRIGIGGRAANVVIEMREPCQDELALRRQLTQQEYKRNGIGTARHSGEYAHVWRPQLMLCGKTPNVVEELFRPGALWVVAAYGAPSCRSLPRLMGRA